jgi:hypothetical protein
MRTGELKIKKEKLKRKFSLSLAGTARCAVRAACSGATSVVGRCIAGGSARGDGAARHPYHRQEN